MITLGKKGSETAYRRAQGFLLKPEVLPRLFSTFAQRYKERPGGYTRIVQIDNRVGDNAPMALLELVDNPRDFKFEMTARAVGRELFTDRLRWSTPRGVLNNGVTNAHSSLSDELLLKVSDKGQLRSVTRRNLQKVLKYRGREALTEISQKASAHIVSIWHATSNREYSMASRSPFLLDRFCNTGHRWPRTRELRMPKHPTVRRFPRHLHMQGPPLLGRFDQQCDLPGEHLHGRADYPGGSCDLTKKVHPNLQLILYKTCGFHEWLIAAQRNLIMSMLIRYCFSQLRSNGEQEQLMELLHGNDEDNSHNKRCKMCYMV